MPHGLFGFSKLKKERINTGLCVACGACAAVCPEEWIEMKDSDIAPDPCKSSHWDRIFCNSCVKVCPAAHVPMKDLETKLFGRQRHQSQPEKTLGVFEECYMARTTVKAIDAEAVAGGVITTVLAYALESGVIDAAVVASFDEERPWMAVPKVATTPEELAAAAGSKYQPHPQILGLKEAVDRGFQKIAVTGTPCHIHALRKMQQSKSRPHRRLADNLVLTIGLVCTTHWTREGTEYLIQRQLGIPLKDVASMKYRARPFIKNGGRFTVETRDGDVKSKPFIGSLLNHLFAASQPDACRTCLDGASHLADISVGDLWGHPTAMDEQLKTGKGHSAVLLRTNLGKDIFHKALSDGWLEAEAVEKEECFMIENGAVYRKAYSNAAFMKWREAHGLPVRRYDYEIEEISLVKS